jgi:hypothetical protein
VADAKRGEFSEVLNIAIPLKSLMRASFLWDSVR